MKISFHHVNPEAGNESFLLRIDRENDDELNPCLLVDAGQDIDLDGVLKPTDRLIGICLTHAHLDHYSELTYAHREDVPIFVSPATAAVLEDVFDVAQVAYGVETSTTITDAITPITEWTSVATGLDIHPVPAGHVPGAVGFLVRVTEGSESHHLLVSGDFTRRRAGGFPGFGLSGAVDALFLTGSTNEEFRSSFTEALGTALEYANGGSKTLVTTSGLVGVHVAYVLSAIAAEYDLRVPIRVVGQVAKLYNALEYDCPSVTSVPLFETTDECLAPGTITIAGPEVPVEQSSGRLYGVLREDPSACVIQLIGSGEEPKTDGVCTVKSYELINHPRRATLEEVAESIDPKETVIVHRHGGAQGEFNDLPGYVWGAGDTDEYTLYDDGRWQTPPWMNRRFDHSHGGQSLGQFVGADLLSRLSVPSLDRHSEVNLDAEGINVDELETILHCGPDAATGPDVPSPSTPSTASSTSPNEPSAEATEHAQSMDEPVSTASDGSGAVSAGEVPTNTNTGTSANASSPADEHAATTTTTTTMTTDSSSSETTETTSSRNQLHRMVGADMELGIDPAVQSTLESNNLTKEELVEAIAARRLQTSAGEASNATSPTSEETDTTTDHTSQPEESSPETQAETADAHASESEANSPETDDMDVTETSDESVVSVDSSSQSTTAETEVSETSESEHASTDTEGDAETQAESTVDSNGTAMNGSTTTFDETGETTTHGASGEETSGATGPDDMFSVELNPLVAAIAVETVDSDDTDAETVDELASRAVEAYVAALLAGEASGNESTLTQVTLNADPVLEQALTRLVEGGGQFDSVSDLVTTGLLSVLDAEVEHTVTEVRGTQRYLDAIVRNDTYDFDNTTEVVETALVWFAR